jgi:hypothetical protein
MYINEKLIKNADLVVPFIGCPIGEPVSECPFISFWKEADTGKRIKQIEEKSEEELQQLRIFHKACILWKIDQLQE